MSDSDSTTQQSTSQEDRRIGIEGGGVVATEGSTINLDSLDPDVIVPIAERAFAFSGDALAQIGTTNLALTELVRERGQEEATTLARDALKVAVPIALVAIAAVGLRRFG